MNAKLLSVILLLAGLIGGYKLGQRSARIEQPQVITENKPSGTAAIARRASTEIQQEPEAATPQDGSLEAIARRVRAALSASSSYQRTALVANAIRKVPVEQLPRLMEMLRDTVNLSYGYTVTYVALPMWAEVDPAAALEYANTLSSSRRSSAITSVLTGWARADLDGAINYVSQLEHGSARTAAAKAIVTILSEQDPARALAFIRSERLHSTRSSSPSTHFFELWGNSDPQSAAAEVLKLPSGKERDYALRNLARSWAGKDPNAALVWVQSLPPSNGRRYAFTAILSAIAETNPALASSQVMTLNGAARYDAIYALTGRWAKHDLNGALNWATGLQGTQERDRALRGLASQWAESDPQSAAAFVDTLPMGTSRSGLTTTIASAWSKKDPSSALNWLQDLPNSSMKNSAMATAVDNMANSDPAGASEWIKAIPSESSRRRLYDDIASGWARKDPESAIAWVESLQNGQRDAARQIVRDMGSRAPARVARFVAGLPDATQYDLVDDIASAWAGSNPTAARQWAEGLPEGRSKTRAMTTLINNVSSSDPQTGAQMALSLGNESSRNSSIQSLAAKWAGNDSEAALAWIETLPGGSTRERAMQGLISGIAGNEPRTAAEYVAGLPAGKIQDSAALTVVSRWASSEPGAAADWAAQFPEGNTRQGAMRSVMNTWGKSDAPTASQFLATLPEGTSRMRAIESFVDAADSRNPEYAAKWVTSLEPNEKNLGRIEKVARYWMAYDPEATKIWLSTTALPEDRRKKVTARSAPTTLSKGYSRYGFDLEAADGAFQTLKFR